MAILVTGGAGFIGSHTCVELLNAGRQVVVLDNFSNSKPQVIPVIEKLGGKKVKLYKADILDRNAVTAVFRENDIEAVIHFAGLKAVGESVEVPLKYYCNNISGTVVLLEEMALAGCKKLVFSSSATVYGMNGDVPFKESHPLSATNPYGRTKLMLEDIMRDVYASDNGWSFALLRYFNPIGAHESGLLGEDPNGIPNNLLPYVARVAAGKLPHVNVFGTDYGTPDGTGVRDYLHVVDLAAGHLKACDYVMGHKGVEAFNLGTGRGTSVLEIIAAFEKASGRPVPFRAAPRRSGDIAASYADPAKAMEILGWQAERGIDKMCEDSWRFVRMQTEHL